MSVLSDVQFRSHLATPKEMGGSTVHTIEAWHSGDAGSDWAKATPQERDTYTGSSLDPGTRPVGSISWHHKTGEIKGVYTAKEHQRQGVASALLNQSQQLAAGTRGVVAPRHSADRTDAGDAWARSVGGRLPARGRTP